MKSRAHHNYVSPTVRAGVICGVLMAIITGVTFAVLQSQPVTIKGSLIQTTTANLQVSPDNNTYSNILDGFVFSNLVPGGQAMPQTGYGFYLKNAGGTPLSLKLAVSSTPSNPNTVDFAKVNIILTIIGAGSQTFTLQNLVDNFSTGGVVVNGNLSANQSQQYKLQVSMTADAFSGTSATIGNLDLAFSGTATN